MLWRKLVKIKSLLLALLILNCSVDAPDSNFCLVYQDYQFKEDVSKNDIENLYEFITEMLLGIDNHVTEYDDSDHEFGLKKIDITVLIELALHPQAFRPYIKTTYPSFSVSLTWEIMKNPYLPPDSVDIS